MLAIGVFVDVIYQVKEAPCISSFLGVPLVNG
jgi:hypothetical protein